MSSPPDQQERAERSDPPSVSIACPSCRILVPVGTECPQCGRATGPAAGATPEVPADATAVLPPVPVRTAELDLAEIAGAAPDPAPASAPAPPLVPDGTSRRTSRRALAVAGGAAGLVLVGAAAVAGLRAGGGPATSASGPSAGGGTVATVEAADITAAASSTQQPEGKVTYSAANTLDGRLETAWNSDGQGVGSSLTYTFGSPVDLRSLTVRNGYQKLLRTSSGRTVDLYALNERVKTFRVVTDGGTTTWTLRDDRDAQTLTRDFGRTRTVRLEVVAVYPSLKYHDLAVSDVAFGAAS